MVLQHKNVIAFWAFGFWCVSPFCARGDVLITTLVSFNGTNGSNPSGLVRGADGNFYGTAAGGGSNDWGTFFEIASNGTLTTVYPFSFYARGLAGSYLVQRKYDGNFYGISFNPFSVGDSCLSRLIAAGPSINVTTMGCEGSNDYFLNGPLMEATDGNFYGAGGTEIFNPVTGVTYGTGWVFKVTFNGRFTTLHSFSDGEDGALPTGSLLEGSDGAFYGTTAEGGQNNGGTVFKITTTGTLTTLYSFSGGNDGYYPRAGLILGTDGAFYGTTANGGTNDVVNGGDGTIFRITTNGSLTTLASFSGSNGRNPWCALVLGRDGNFYGTTAYGGAFDGGTVFRVTPTGVLTSLASFNGTNGAYPRSTLVEGMDGNFYGTTPEYDDDLGNIHLGTVFRFNTAPPPLMFQAIMRVPDGIAFAWTAVTGKTYVLEYKTNFVDTSWLNVGTPLVATNTVLTSWDVLPLATTHRFYRVRLLP